MAKIKYFNGTEELNFVTGYPNDQFKASGGKMSKANYYDGYNRMMGRTFDGRLLPVERKITYKSQPSLHVCNAKCMNGKENGTCECQCGGKNHGAGMFTNLIAA